MAEDHPIVPLPTLPKNTRVSNLSGQVFGRLTVETYGGRKYYSNGWWQHVWSCRCSCGTTAIVTTYNLVNSITKSCGCLRKASGAECRSYKHGLYKSLEYMTWRSMMRRCYYTGNNSYSKYGGAGVTVCDRWRNNFLDFLADMGPRPSLKHSIDRFPDRKGNYEPGNCRWATASQQNRNRCTSRMITYDGKTLALPEWAELTGLSKYCIAGRLKAGWADDKALTTPSQRKKPTGE